jgi:hypothetical protein
LLSSLKSMDSPKREGFALKSSTVLKVHPVAVTCERLKSPKPPFGGRKSGTPKNPKARKDRSRSPRRSKSPSGPRSLEGCKDSGRNSCFSEREALRPSQESRCLTVGRILKSLKTWGLLREEEKPRRVSATKSPRGNQRPHAQRKPNKQFTAGDLVLRWAYSSSLHLRVFREELRKVPPFPLKPQGTGGSACYGEFESPRRNTASGSSSFPQGLPHPWIVERCNRTFREGSLVLWFHHKKRTEEVEKRKRRDSSLGRGSLGGAERYWTFQVSHMMWTYTPVGCPPRSQSGFLVLPPSSPSPQR